MISLGLDIGSNSVGSAWVDTEQKITRLAVGIFPAGVDETDTKRGSPINQSRRQARSTRRSLARRARRKRFLRMILIKAELLPDNSAAFKSVLDHSNPWFLRRDSLKRELTPHEFGRVIMHLNQRRGAVGIETDPDDQDEGKVKEAIDRTRAWLAGRTFGQGIADEIESRRKELPGKPGATVSSPVRNRRDSFEFHADRNLIRAEFLKMWEYQKSHHGELARLLTEDLKLKLDNPQGDDLWRTKGILFGQRRTYWDAGTIGRCDLEPTDLRCPMADMYAQEFRVLETVNNIRVEERGKPERPLNVEERAKVISVLRAQKTGSPKTIRKAMGIDKKDKREFYSLNIERDENREINTDWFYREIVHGVFTEPQWLALQASQRDSVNRAILKFDCDVMKDAETLRAGAKKWWALSNEQADKLVSAWKTRPKVDKRINLSRKALMNLLPWIREPHCSSVSEARQRFAKDGNNGASDTQRTRYALNSLLSSKADRQFLKKHPNLLPLAPELANPVVRKAIHEVRHHVIAHLREFKQRPERVVIELTRSATQSQKVRDRILADNRKRESERKRVIEDFKLGALSFNQQKRAVERVLLCRQQHGFCAYSWLDRDEARPITEKMAAEGKDVEVDHIVPISRSQDNGMNNKVLVFREANRNKGNLTPKELLSSQEFERLCQRFRFWTDEASRKWENLIFDAPDRQTWLSSQLTDTAYAATQVADYLQSALFGDKKDGKRRIFFTKGSYTSILRKDWQLQDADAPKSRDDHRHHAVDAVVIALSGPERLGELAKRAEAQEKAKSESGHWPEYEPIESPWATIPEFRHQIMAEAHRLVVSHRPVKRKITGYLHKADLWGAVDESHDIFRIRCPIAQLSPKMLRMPVDESDTEVKKRLFAKFKAENYSDKDARRKTKDVLDQGRFKRRLVDPSLGKGGLVRDWTLRKIIRECLRKNDIDPDSFSEKQMQEFAKAGKLTMPSGVPIKTVITIAPISDPIKIAVRDPFTSLQAVKPVTNEPVFRYHISRNNHHLEILEDIQTGEWSDEPVTTFVAAQRRSKQLNLLREAEKPLKALKPSKHELRERLHPVRSRIFAENPIVNRADRGDKRFVMSLSEGETINMRNPDSGQEGYFVVFKISPGRVFFIHHWDARASVLRKDSEGNVIANSKREEIDVAVSSLKNWKTENGKSPQKVRIGLLGKIIPLIHD